MSKKKLLMVNLEPEFIDYLDKLSDALITSKSAIARAIIENSLVHPGENLPEVLRNQILKVNKQKYQLKEN